MEPLPNTPQFITSIIHRLSQFHPPPLGEATATTTSRPLDQHNSSRYQHHHHVPPTEANNNNKNPLSQLPAPLLSKVKPLLLTLHCLFPNELLLALDILDRNGVTRYYDNYNPKPRSSEAAADKEQQQHGGGDVDGGIYFVHSSSAPSSSSYSSGMNLTRPNNNNNTYNYNNKNTNNNDNPAKTHLVCLNAWNCSCPAFALAAYQHLDSLQTTTTTTEAQQSSSGGVEGENDLPPFAPQPRHVYHDNDNNDDDDVSYRGNNTPFTSASASASTSQFFFGGTLTRSSRKNMHYGTPVCKHLLACLLGSQCPALFGGGVNSVYVGDGVSDDGIWEVAGRFAAV
ncbi:hypothetical protein ACJ72_04688 [Emergomyces africanus]|uniref:SWIM-type domain-containing protein n=1 Tax=Emergomyces africanus TaxID=1955775 RepID=A0A1B7NW08_9EURO|nr:hypothetical protein ACJ72_04688 [Emergomyces africanus]